MNWRTLAGTAAVTAVSLAVLGITSNFLLTNALFRSTERVAASLSLAVVLTSLVVFAALGRPWQGWDRTPYW